jgi:hypothetical protein
LRLPRRARPRYNPFTRRRHARGTVILDDELKAKLNGLNQPLEIRDASGKVIGWFIPEEDYQAILERTEQAREWLPHHVSSAPTNE